MIIYTTNMVLTPNTSFVYFSLNIFYLVNIYIHQTNGISGIAGFSTTGPFSWNRVFTVEI